MYIADRKGVVGKKPGEIVFALVHGELAAVRMISGRPGVVIFVVEPATDLFQIALI